MDAQEAAARRGYVDLTGDVETQGLRQQQDYGLQTEQINRERGWSLEDLGSSLARGRADLSMRSTRGQEDYTRSLAQLAHRYETLGRNQLQAGNAAGVLRGGAMLQAAAKRAANSQWEREPLDASWKREQEDVSTSRARMDEDYTRSVSRTNQGADWNIGMAGLGYQRGATDLNTQLTRGGRELGSFSLDTAAQRAYQAAGTGWDPGQGPANEFTRNGQTYQVRREGNYSVAYRPNGTVLWRRPRRAR